MTAPFNGRREDHRLTTGAGCFTADVSLPGQVYAAFLRADHAHARLNGLDTTAAAAAPGVLAVLTGADMIAAGYTRGAAQFPFRDRDGTPLHAPAKPALAHDRLRYVGEPAALVIATSEAAALDARDLIDLDIDPLDAVTDVTDALAPGSPTLHDEIPANLAYTHLYGDADATTAAFAAAAHLVEIDLESARVIGSPMEPKAALAQWDGDTLTLWTPSQGMPGLRAGVAEATGLPTDRVRMQVRDVGGAFGLRGPVYPEYIALAHAARVTGRPVKWVASRSETFVSDFHGRAVRAHATLALDADGRMIGLRHDWICDLGAHPSAAGPLTFILATQMATGAYRIPAVSGRIRLAVTNKVPTTAYRGAGRPEMAYVVERLVDAAARATGIDRIEIRRRNMIPADAFPYPLPHAPAPVSYDSADFATLITRAVAIAGWDGFEDRRAAAAARGRLRGIGCALFIEPSGGVAPSDEGAITFDAAGHVRLHEVAVASGQGHETVFPEIVGRALGIDPMEITLHAARPDGPAQKGGGAFGSRSLMSQGSVLAEAARGVLTKARALAAVALGVAEGDLTYTAGAFGASGTNRTLTLQDIARAHPGALDTLAELPSPRAFPSGMHIAEVEVDPETGATDILAYTSVDDCGVIQNLTLVEGQIWGGLLQGLGQVFGEIASYDSAGQLLSGSFMDYPMPRADLLPRATIEAVEVPSPTNQLGAKGVGEAGTVGALPAAMNAVLDALRPAGVTALDMPATPARVWAALHAAGH